MQIRTLDPADWPALAARFDDLTFEQTADYAIPAAARIGGQARFVVLEEDAGPVAAAALRIRSLPGLGRGIAWCPSGPLVLAHDGPAPDEGRLAALLRALREEVASRQGHVLRLRPSGLSFLPAATLMRATESAGYTRFPRLRPYRSIALDLALDEDELQRRLHGKWRTDLRFALKSGLEVEGGNTPALQARFLAMFAATEAAKGFRPDIPPEFHFPLAGPGYRVEVLLASKDGQDLAGIVLGLCPASSTYLFGATLPAGRPLRAGYLLQWQALALARAHGCRWHDLGGIDSAGNPDVTRFKTRMSGTPIEAEAWQAAPAGVVAPLILGLERLRNRLKRGAR